MHKFTKSIGINLIIEKPSWRIDYLDLNFNLLNHGIAFFDPLWFYPVLLVSALELILEVNYSLPIAGYAKHSS